ncbi:hypothetical protein CROQUDRAFT_44200, partial [Cronartium quercuum f. sp. fusiforme G11]
MSGATQVKIPSESSSSSNTHKTIRITAPTKPGPDSNYLDWAFVARLHFRSAKLGYLLHPIDVKDRPGTWAEDNDIFCSTIAQIVEEPNSKYIRKFERDAYSMWNALQAAHEDQSSGGRVYWLHKLILKRMSSGEDITTHVANMHRIYERLDALITPMKPLTVDDIYAAALIISLPPEWHSVINPLLQKESLSSEAIKTLLENTN